MDIGIYKATYIQLCKILLTALIWISITLRINTNSNYSITLSVNYLTNANNYLIHKNYYITNLKYNYYRNSSAFTKYHYQYISIISK